MGWQWSAGSGADAAPYFRIFNPVTQGEKFDPEGDYVRAWVPELSRLPKKYLHKPWQAPDDVLADAGVAPGDDYPHPIVDLDETLVFGRHPYLVQRQRTGIRRCGRGGLQRLGRQRPKLCEGSAAVCGAVARGQRTVATATGALQP